MGPLSQASSPASRDAGPNDVLSLGVDSSVASPASGHPHKRKRVHRDLGDFTTDARLLVIVAMAVVVGAISAFVAVALVWLIGVITNLAYYHRLSSTMVSPAANQLGWWAV